MKTGGNKPAFSNKSAYAGIHLSHGIGLFAASIFSQTFFSDKRKIQSGDLYFRLQCSARHVQARYKQNAL
jgi:hypothetical protein